MVSHALGEPHSQQIYVIDECGALMVDGWCSGLGLGGTETHSQPPQPQTHQTWSHQPAGCM
jgi:hypothetical protein